MRAEADRNVPPLKGLRHSSSRKTFFQHLLIRALPAAVEPGLEFADADRVLGLGLLDAGGQAGRWAARTRGIY
jgi:hypothetical protein